MSVQNNGESADQNCKIIIYATKTKIMFALLFICYG